MKKEMNNKGFSLVELIIVIAIMAILLVVLAPQYLKYVERSRNSTDLQNATEVVTALQVYAADPEATETMPATGIFKLQFTRTGNATITEISGSTFVNAALDDAGLLDASGNLATRCQSTQNWNDYIIEGTSNGSGGIEFTYSQTAAVPTGAIGFADRMAGQTASGT